MNISPKALKYTLIALKNLNFLILLFVSVVMSYCLNGFIHEGSGLVFLSKIRVLPLSPIKIPIVVLCLYFSVLSLMSLRDLKGLQVNLSLVVQGILIFLICYLIDFSYTGIALLLLANSIDYFQDTKWRITFIISFCVVYLITEYLILDLNSEINSFNVYLTYFQSNARVFFQGILNLMTSLNLLLFLVYVVMLVSLEYNEKEHVISLNEKLNKTNLELKEANAQLEEYSEELIKMTETRERNRLAMEIHDTLGHTLTGIITGLEACIALIDIAPEATKEQLKSIIEVASQGMTDVRRSVSALRPDRLEKLVLENAIYKMINEMVQATNTKIECEISADLTGLSNEEEDVIYRIIQESITNSIRHGKAENIRVRIAEENDCLAIRIKDDGIGCKEIHKGFGLHHMVERLNLLKGSLRLSGEDGFLVQAEIPMRLGEQEV